MIKHIVFILLILFPILVLADTPPYPPANFIDSLSKIGNNVSLQNDSASPGASKYYGTNGSSVLGYFSVPTFSGVTAVTGTAPIVSSGGSTPNLTCNVASGSQAGCLASADWTTFNNKQPAGNYLTSLTATAPIVSTGGTTPALTCNVASGSQPGCLSSSDWTTFNGKQASGNYITALTGDVTATGPGSVASTVAKIQGTVVSGTTGTGNVAFSAGPTFSGEVLTADGNSTTPGIGFSAEPTSGFYRQSTGHVSMGVDGVLAMDSLKVGSNVNTYFGNISGVSSSPSNPFQVESTYNGTQYIQFNNANTGANSQTVFEILNGNASLNNATEIGNAAYQSSGYVSGGSWLAATAFQTQLNIGAEGSSAFITLNTGGALSATTERVRLTNSAFTINKGTNLVLSGSTSGALTLNAGATGSYALNFPTANASGAFLNDGSGNISFGYPTGSVSITTGSVSVTTATQFLIVNSSSPVTITLPDATLSVGYSVMIKNINTGAVTVATVGGQTIDGASTQVLPSQYMSANFLDANGGWYIW